MGKKYNIFIEGIPGSGKSTLLNTLASLLTDYNIFREGDISPIELAWCSYMSEEQYNKALVDMVDYRNEIEAKTVKEGDYFITPYTKIHAENYEFYKYMEKHEIYAGRRDTLEFKNIIFQRFRRFNSYGNIFECSFFQNIIEELMLFLMFSDEQIVNFYKEVISLIHISSFKLIRLVDSDIRTCIETIKRERVNEKGEEEWYQSMLNYLASSPYGKAHNISGFEDMVTHFKRRINLENEVIKLLPDGCCVNVESKKYSISDILRAFPG